MNADLAKVKETLEAALNGLKWYRAEFPEADSSADDEMHQQIDQAVALLSSVDAELGEHEASADSWRTLALQFDGHRMQALGHLRAMFKNPFEHCRAAQAFLSQPPIPGEAVLRQRLSALPTSVIRPTFVHDKTGGKYTMVGRARMQTATPQEDMDSVVVYEGEDGQLWVRPVEEFEERFTRTTDETPARTTAEFEKQDRYLVFKLKDVDEVLTDDQKKTLQYFSIVVNSHRIANDRPSLETLVIEKDWPEYDAAWAMLIARVTLENRT